MNASENQKMDFSLIIFTHQVSHYHLARYRAAVSKFKKLTVISATNDADFSEFLAGDASEIEIIRLFNDKKSYLRAVRSGELRRTIYARLDEISPDVVAVAGWSFAESLSAIGWTRRRGARVIMMSESQSIDGRRWRPREALKSRIVKACDLALVGGSRQRDYIVGLGMPEAHVFLGYDAVDNDHFAIGAEHARAQAALFRRRLGLPDRYILASARFITKKNLVRLIEAFERAIRTTTAPHSLVVLGGGPDHSLIEASIVSSGLSDRILLAGFKDYDTLPLFYGLAEAFAHVSFAEQWGLVINEAAAAGLPLVVSRTCGAAAELVVEGKNGYLVDPEDVEDIASRLGIIMTATEEERVAMGSNSRKFVREWGPGRFAYGLQCAANVARVRSARELTTWDGAVIYLLSHFSLQSVS